MKRRRLSIAVVSVAIFLCLGAPKDKDQPKLTYLSPASIDVVQLLPDPPKAGSKERQGEIQEVLDAQATRSGDEIARAKSEEKLSVFAFKDVLGESFTAENCPKTAERFKAVGSDSKYFSDLAKAHFNVPRPYVADERIKAIFTADEGSYPSGHATRGLLFALLLAEALPDQREALITRGQQIGWDRVIAGVHYESDLVAGRVLAKATARELLANSIFREKLDEVKQELQCLPHEAAVPAGK